MKIHISALVLLTVAVITQARYWYKSRFEDGIERCEREGEDFCKCEKYFEGIPGQGCSEGRHNCDDSRTCYMNHDWHACCLDEEAAIEDENEEIKAEFKIKDETHPREYLGQNSHFEEADAHDEIEGISRCEREGDDSCKCEKYYEGIPGQGCSEGRHNCDDSKTCYMNHPWHACCLDEEAAVEDENEEIKADFKMKDETHPREYLRQNVHFEEADAHDEIEGISRCEREGDDSCKCEKYYEGIPGQGCSEGRHNCDDSKTCYMNHPWHACCLDEETAEEDEIEV